MIPLAIFPCRFTDSARILGELSYTLSIPVYNDQMILTEMSNQLDMRVDELQTRLFGCVNWAGLAGMEKECLIEAVQNHMDRLQASDTEYIYYGFSRYVLISSPDTPIGY